MPVSQQFAELFAKMIEDYEKKSKKTYLYQGDTNREQNITLLEGLKFHPTYNDRALLEFLSVSAIEALQTDPVFAGYVSQLINQYNKNADLPYKTLRNGLSIESNKGAQELNWIDDLNQALLLQSQSHNLQINVLNQQIYQLTEAFQKVTAKNADLQVYIEELEKVKADYQQFKKAIPLMKELGQLVTEAPHSSMTLAVETENHVVTQPIKTTPEIKTTQCPINPLVSTVVAPSPPPKPPHVSAPKQPVISAQKPDGPQKPLNFLEELRKKAPILNPENRSNIEAKILEERQKKNRP